MDNRNDRGDKACSVSLIIPAYNEANCISQAVAEADLALAELGGDYEIVVIDDGSSDGTAEVVATAARDRPRVRLLRHPANRGYGAALRKGFEAARFDRVAFTDADCQFDLRDLAPSPAANESSGTRRRLSPGTPGLVAAPLPLVGLQPAHQHPVRHRRARL